MWLMAGDLTGCLGCKAKDTKSADTFRVIYTVRFEQVIYVLHCFQKESPSEIKTASTDADLIHERLRLEKSDYEVRYGKKLK